MTLTIVSIGPGDPSLLKRKSPARIDLNGAGFISGPVGDRSDVSAPAAVRDRKTAFNVHNLIH